MPEFDPVNNPSHYIKSSVLIQPIELTARLNSCLGQALNYIFRAPYKNNKEEDIQKAIFYFNKYKDVIASKKEDWEFEIDETAWVLGRIFAAYTKDPFAGAVLETLFRSRVIKPEVLDKVIDFLIKYLAGEES